MKKLILLIIAIAVAGMNYAQKPASKLNFDDKLTNPLGYLSQSDSEHFQNLQSSRNDFLFPNPIEKLGFDKDQFLKSIEETVLQLDSIIIESYNSETDEWKLAAKYQYEVGESENITNYMRYFWDDTTLKWIGYPYNIYEYNESGNLARKVINEFNFDGTTILKYFKYEYLYTYENGGTQETYISYKYNLNINQFVPDYKHESYYDEKENLIKYITYHWNSETENWIINEKNEYGYDDNGNQILVVNLSWIENLPGWYGHKKGEYVFDETGNKISELVYFWDPNAEDFLLQNKYEYEYNETGELVTETFLYPGDGEDEWVNYSRIENFYDENGNRIMHLRSNWNDEEDSWIPEYKEENGFDSASNQTFSSSYTWSEELNQLIGIQKQEFDYDEKGNRILTSLYLWDNNLADWAFEKYQLKSEYEFNISGKVVLKTNFEWRDEQWMKSSRYEYDYDAMGRKIFEQSANWIDDFGDWRYSKKQELAFNSEGKYLLQIDYEWDIEKNEWKLLNKYEYDYDANGRTTLSSSLRYYFNDYYDGRRSEYIFDGDGMQTLYGSYIWDNDLEQWVGNTKTVTTYIEKNVPLVDSFFVWDASLSDWSLKSRNTYYYSEEVVQSSPNISDESSVTVYPNPASEYLLVDISGRNYEMQFELYDFNGKKVFSGNLSHRNRLSVENLTSGIYIWKIIQETEVSTGKIIIE